MMNYKPASFSLGKRERPIRTIKMQIEEKPTRKEYSLLTNKARYAYLTMIKNKVRSMPDYREYIDFLKKHRGQNSSLVLPAAIQGNGKKYSIELHHEPFSLIEITDIVVTKREAHGESLNPFEVIEEILELHFDEKVGLIPLDKTSHELCESGLIFVPLQDIYQRFDKFFDEYDAICEIPEKIIKSLEIKVQMSELLKSGKVYTDYLEPEFTYLDVNGQLYPEVPESWGKLLAENNHEEFLKM